MRKLPLTSALIVTLATLAPTAKAQRQSSTKISSPILVEGKLQITQTTPLVVHFANDSDRHWSIVVRFDNSKPDLSGPSTPPGRSSSKILKNNAHGGRLVAVSTDGIERPLNLSYAGERKVRGFLANHIVATLDKNKPTSVIDSPLPPQPTQKSLTPVQLTGAITLAAPSSAVTAEGQLAVISGSNAFLSAYELNPKEKQEITWENAPTGLLVIVTPAGSIHPLLNSVGAPLLSVAGTHKQYDGFSQGKKLSVVLQAP